MEHGRVLCAVVCLTLVSASGCAGGSTQRSTRLTSSDFDVTVSEMAAQLAASDFLADRSPQSPPVRIVTRQVENLTTDVISPAEQWMMIARVQASLPIQELAQLKNIVFQIPPEEVERLRKKGFSATLAPEHQPTHLMTAVFQSATRAGRGRSMGYVDLRKEYYLLEYQIVDLKTREPEWSGRYELAREAGGLAID